MRQKHFFLLRQGVYNGGTRWEMVSAAMRRRSNRILIPGVRSIPLSRSNSKDHFKPKNTNVVFHRCFAAASITTIDGTLDPFQ
jgi:hypothetical protein